MNYFSLHTHTHTDCKSVCVSYVSHVCISNHMYVCVKVYVLNTYTFKYCFWGCSGPLVQIIFLSSDCGKDFLVKHAKGYISKAVDTVEKRCKWLARSQKRYPVHVLFLLIGAGLNGCFGAAPFLCNKQRQT